MNVDANETNSDLSRSVASVRNRANSRSLWLRIGRALIGIALLVGIGLGLYEGYRRISAGVAGGSDVLTHVVQRRTLDDTVIERGTIESQNTIYGKCELPGSENSIVSIVPEGTFVKQGDVIVKLESAKIDALIAAKRVTLSDAKGKLREAEQNKIAKENEADGKIVVARRELELAGIEVEKYGSGDFNAEVSELLRLIEDSKASRQKLLDDRSNIEVLVKKGYRSPEQLEEYRLRLSSISKQIQRDEQKLHNLRTYDHKLKMTTFKGKQTDAGAKLLREESTRDAEIERAQAAIDSARSAVDLHQGELNELEKTLNKCIMTAPLDGTVAYANQPWFDSSQRIRSGSRVFQQQNIYFLPDMSKMQVKLSVHESVINRIKKDQKVSIRLDAFPDVKLKGTISQVAELAASSFDDAKNYDATVLIEEIPSGVALKPGMTAEVEILVGTYDEMLGVPVGAVTEHFQQTYVYVSKVGTFSRRPVKIGRSTHSFVEIVEGLEPGDTVAMDAYQRGTNEFAAAERKASSGGPESKSTDSAASPNK